VTEEESFERSVGWKIVIFRSFKGHKPGIGERNADVEVSVGVIEDEATRVFEESEFWALILKNTAR